MVHTARVSRTTVSRCESARGCRSAPADHPLAARRAACWAATGRLSTIPRPSVLSPPCHQASIAMRSLNHEGNPISRPFMSLRPNPDPIESCRWSRVMPTAKRSPTPAIRASTPRRCPTTAWPKHGQSGATSPPSGARRTSSAVANSRIDRSRDRRAWFPSRAERLSPSQPGTRPPRGPLRPRRSRENRCRSAEYVGFLPYCLIRKDISSCGSSKYVVYLQI